jgi:tryptophanyl-tRNA synthetase
MPAQQRKRPPRVFSGVQPSGHLTIGNYLGALKQWAKVQHDYESFFCVVDLHAITVPQDPKDMCEGSREVAGLYLAAGIDPSRHMPNWPGFWAATRRLAGCIG